MGFPSWDYCTEDAEDGHRSAREDEVHYSRGHETEAEIIVILPLSAPVDTLTMESDVLTWEYNRRSEPGASTDLLRFRRLAAGEGEGPVCTFLL